MNENQFVAVNKPSEQETKSESDIVDTTNNNKNKFESVGYQQDTGKDYSNMFAPTTPEDFSVDPTKFDFQLKIGADNEEIRAQNQGLLELYGKSAIQTAAVGVGGAISGLGYMSDLVTNLPELINGEEVQFESMLTRIGEGIQDYASEELAPIYQTRRAQEGGWRSLGDATYFAGNAPTIASSVAIMAPTYAVTRALSAVGKAFKATRAGRKAGETVAEYLSPAIKQALNSRRAQGITNHIGNSVLSRHTYNSLEANDTYQQVYEESLRAGDDIETAKKKAGQAGAYVYRTGYVNIWKDALQWKIILGTKYSSAKASQPWFTKSGAATTTIADKRRLIELGKKFPGGRIPQRAMMQAGIAGKKGKEALKAVAKMGLGESVEEINIQHQKQLAKDYVDMINEADSSEPMTGWGDIYSDMASDYFGSLANFVYDEDSVISPEAFDAAFWAFMSGAAMGGVMKAGQSFMDKKFGSAASSTSRQKEELEYFKNRTASYQKALVENDQVAADQIMDEMIFDMAIKGFSEGNTSVDGALSGARFEDLLKSLEGIVQADDTTLENSGISPDPEMRQLYERMYADLQTIEDMFEKNFSTQAGFGEQYDRKIATAQTYYEFQKQRWNERADEYKGRAEEIRSKIDNSVFEDGYQAIADNKAQVEGWKQARDKFKTDLADIKKAEPSVKGDEFAKQRKIAQYEAQIELVNSRIKELTDERKDLYESVKKSDEQESIADTYVENQTELVQLESDIAQYESSIETLSKELKKLSTKKGQQDYVKRIKKVQKEALNNERIAKIEKAETLENLNEIDLDETSAEVERVFNDKKDILKRRDREVANVKKPEVDQEHIDQVDKKVPFISEAHELEKFIEEVEAREDLHGNTKKAIAKYATQVFEASQEGQEIELSKQEARDLKDKFTKEGKKSHISNLESITDAAEAKKYIDKTDLSKEEKDQLTEFYRKHTIARLDRINPDDLKVFKDAKVQKDINEGKEPELSPDDLTLDPSETLEAETQDESTPQEEGITDPSELEISPTDDAWLEDWKESTFPDKQKQENPTEEFDKKAYRGVPVKVDTSIPSGARAKDGTILVNPEKIMEIFKEKRWTDPKEFTTEIYKDATITSKVTALPENLFKTYKHFEDFVLEHEYQHLLNPRKKFKELYDSTDNALYEDWINKLALENLRYNIDIYDAPWFPFNENVESESLPENKEATKDTVEQSTSETAKSRQEPGIFTLSKVQYKYNSEKQSKEPQFNLKESDFEIVQTPIVRSNPDVKFEEMANPNLKEGSEVKLVLQKNSYSKKFNDDASFPIAVVNENGDKVGLINSAKFTNNPETRKAITAALKEGKEVTATVVNKEDGVFNLNNMKDKDGYYFRSVKTLENRWVEQEDGSWAKDTAPVILTTSEGFGEGRMLSISEEGFNFLPEHVKAKIAKDIQETKLESDDGTRLDGHVFAVIPRTQGRYRAVKMLTQNLSDKAVDKAFEAIMNNDIETASEIVHTDSNLEANPELYLSMHEASFLKDGESAAYKVIQYFDDSLGKIVQLSRSDGESTFTIKELKDDIDTSEGLTKDHFKMSDPNLDYKKGLRNLLKRKKYNVDRDRVGQLNTPYESRVTGESYDSYYDYLTSTDELSVDNFRGDGDAQAIVATDIYNDDGSFYSNVGIQIQIDDMQQPKQQQQQTKEEVITKKEIHEPKKEKPKTRKRVRKTGKSKVDQALEKAYNESSELQEKYVSLNDLKDRYIHSAAPNVDMFIESQIERIKNNC